MNYRILEKYAEALSVLEDKSRVISTAICDLETHARELTCAIEELRDEISEAAHYAEFPPDDDSAPEGGNDSLTDFFKGLRDRTFVLDAEKGGAAC